MLCDDERLILSPPPLVATEGAGESCLASSSRRLPAELVELQKSCSTSKTITFPENPSLNSLFRGGCRHVKGEGIFFAGTTKSCVRAPARAAHESCECDRVCEYRIKTRLRLRRRRDRKKGVRPARPPPSSPRRKENKNRRTATAPPALWLRIHTRRARRLRGQHGVYII
jgi:hypothetical protein